MPNAGVAWLEPNMLPPAGACPEPAPKLNEGAAPEDGAPPNIGVLLPPVLPPVLPPNMEPPDCAGFAPNWKDVFGVVDGVEPAAKLKPPAGADDWVAPLAPLLPEAKGLLKLLLPLGSAPKLKPNELPGFVVALPNDTPEFAG